MPRATQPLEFARIDVLSSIFRAASDAEVGIGDDAAVLAPAAGKLVCSVDAAVEGVHFERSWLAPNQIGYRAFMAAASDLAAMGAVASHALCAWTLPEPFDEASLRELALGVERASSACECPVVGGNLSRSDQLTLTTTVLGRLTTAAVRRSGGRPGDTLFVTGPLGGPRLGLERLRGGQARADDPFVRAFCTPRARLDVANALALHATCAIDISDGLCADLLHLCSASDVGASLTLASLPRLPGFAENAADLALSARESLLHGGEEYELLFASAATTLPWAHAVGKLRLRTDGPGQIDVDGEPVSTAGRFQHFA